MEEDDIEAALRQQDEAMALLERLRIAEPMSTEGGDYAGGGRRDFRRWPTPDGVAVEAHDSSHWQTLQCSDLGIGGVKITQLPPWLDGPVPIRLKGSTGHAILVLGDLMWRDQTSGAAGLRLEFQDQEERDLWTGVLIDALLARYALG